MAIQLMHTVIMGRNKYHFTFTGANFHEVVMERQKLSFPNVEACGLCGSDNLALNARVTKEKQFKYISVRCQDCGGDLTFGKEMKDPDTYFLRRDANRHLDWKQKPQDEA